MVLTKAGSFPEQRQDRGLPYRRAGRAAQPSPLRDPAPEEFLLSEDSSLCELSSPRTVTTDDHPGLRDSRKKPSAFMISK